MRHAPFTQRVDENVCAFQSRLIFLPLSPPGSSNKNTLIFVICGLGLVGYPGQHSWFQISIDFNIYRLYHIGFVVFNTVLSL